MSGVLKQVRGLDRTKAERILRRVNEWLFDGRFFFMTTDRLAGKLQRQSEKFSQDRRRGSAILSSRLRDLGLDPAADEGRKLALVAGRAYAAESNHNVSPDLAALAAQWNNLLKAATEVWRLRIEAGDDSFLPWAKDELDRLKAAEFETREEAMIALVENLSPGAAELIPGPYGPQIFSIRGYHAWILPGTNNYGFERPGFKIASQRDHPSVLEVEVLEAESRI